MNYAHYVWNNDRDTAHLRNPAGSLVHPCSDNSTAVDHKVCRPEVSDG